MTYPLPSDFPTDTTADTLATIAKLDQLVRDGFLTDSQASVVLDNIGTFIDTKAETYALVSATYTGAAGSTDRKYAVVPVYPLPTTPVGQNLTAMPNPPPQGWTPGDAVSNLTAATGSRTVRYGKLGTVSDVPSTAATLDGTHSVAIVLPAASADFPGVKFDVLVQDGGAGDWHAIALGQAPGATVTDSGQARQTYSIAPNTNARYAHAEVGVDTTTTPHTLIFGSTVFVNGDVV